MHKKMKRFCISYKNTKENCLLIKSSGFQLQAGLPSIVRQLRKINMKCER